MTDYDPRSESPLAALRHEAHEARDEAMVRIVDDALYGDAAALAECERVIADSQAMAADDEKL